MHLSSMSALIHLVTHPGCSRYNFSYASVPHSFSTWLHILASLWWYLHRIHKPVVNSTMSFIHMISQEAEDFTLFSLNIPSIHYTTLMFSITLFTHSFSLATKILCHSHQNHCLNFVYFSNYHSTFYQSSIRKHLKD